MHVNVAELHSTFNDRLLHPRCMKERFRRSFLPAAVRLYNQNYGPLPTLEPFAGDSDKCAGFLAQSSLVFREQQHFHNNDGAKITFFVELLRDRLLKWAQVVLSSDPGISYADFLSKFKTVFNKGSGTEAAALCLCNFKQGKRNMSDYSIDFWILAEETGWGQEDVHYLTMFVKK
uniref:DUF4939 domain-containing protein n=1 Tax=Neolamprologus brichardi TaxID=32507 RepID=A0A3Q4GE94_NEOBR